MSVCEGGNAVAYAGFEVDTTSSHILSTANHLMPFPEPPPPPLSTNRHVHHTPSTTTTAHSNQPNSPSTPTALKTGVWSQGLLDGHFPSKSNPLTVPASNPQLQQASMTHARKQQHIHGRLGSKPTSQHQAYTQKSHCLFPDWCCPPSGTFISNTTREAAPSPLCGQCARQPSR